MPRSGLLLGLLLLVQVNPALFQPHQPTSGSTPFPSPPATQIRATSVQTTTATLTVLDHSNASLSSTATQTTQTINFGNVLRGATIPSQCFSIYNRAANTSATYTANLKLTTGFTTTGDGALTTNLAPFYVLDGGQQ